MIDIEVLVQSLKKLKEDDKIAYTVTESRRFVIITHSNKTVDIAEIRDDGVLDKEFKLKTPANKTILFKGLTKSRDSFINYVKSGGLDYKPRVRLNSVKENL